MKFKKMWRIAAMAAVVVIVLIAVSIWGGNPNAVMECAECEGVGCELCEGVGTVAAATPYYATWVSLLAPVIAIVFALVTKEVFSSLTIGIIAGGLLANNFNIVKTLNCVVEDGLITAVSGTAGIFVFLVILGIMVCLINQSGGSAAFGRWASKHVKSKSGASIATFILGVLIFIDDYFNCLTVGSVMRPLTDTQRVSRVKLAYLIDATAAPVCMIAPISSWAAAVSSYAPEGQGISLFVRAIPYNLYSLLTFVFIIAIIIMKFDFGPMRKFEEKAEAGNLSIIDDVKEADELKENEKGKVIDLVIPVLMLIVCNVLAIIYNGGFFTAGSEFYHDFVGAFSNTDVTVALPLGSAVALVLTIIYCSHRRLIKLEISMEAFPVGFKAMVSAILILTLATSLKNMTGLLGSPAFVQNAMSNTAAGFANFLPAIIFLVAVGISFATGTSWGTFGILIPIVVTIFPEDSKLLIIGMSACLAGAVCGDHCSPISDTTIMSSAGAQCMHVDHVSTQLPYALFVAAISFVGYLMFAFVQAWYVVLPIMSVITVLVLFVIKRTTNKKAA